MVLLVGNELTVCNVLMLKILLHKIGGDNASIVFLNIICADNAQNEEKFSA